VGLAHAMMSDPEILVQDEPTSGLDPNQIVEIREIIRKIGEEKTVILSTHILSEAEATCDRIVIINKGKIIADGSTQDIKSKNSQADQIRIALRQADFDTVRTQLKSVNGVQRIEQTPSEDQDLLIVNVYSKDNNDPRADLYQVIKTTDWVLIDFHQETKTLESIFRELTREN
jgi:ABC-2 type transport system ATP-binding protein